MKPRILIILLFLAFNAGAQPVKIKFVIGSEVATELTSVTDIHAITEHGPYNFHEIKTMSFWGTPPDSITINHLRTNGIGVYLKNRYLKPNMVKSEKAFEAKIKTTSPRGDSILIKGSRFYQGSVRLGHWDVLSVLENNPASHAEAKTARSNFNAELVVSFIAGALIGYPLGQEIAGKVEPQWGYAAGGVALLIGSIPLHNAYKRHVKNAIEIYNANPRSALGTSIMLAPALNGATLYVRF